MKNIKFVVKVSRAGSVPAFVQRTDRTPIQMTTNRKLALEMGKLTAEDTVKFIKLLSASLSWYLCRSIPEQTQTHTHLVHKRSLNICRPGAGLINFDQSAGSPSLILTTEESTGGRNTRPRTERAETSHPPSKCRCSLAHDWEGVPFVAVFPLGFRGKCRCPTQCCRRFSWKSSARSPWCGMGPPQLGADCGRSPRSPVESQSSATIFRGIVDRDLYHRSVRAISTECGTARLLALPVNDTEEGIRLSRRGCDGRWHKTM